MSPPNWLITSNCHSPKRIWTKSHTLLSLLSPCVCQACWFYGLQVTGGAMQIKSGGKCQALKRCSWLQMLAQPHHPGKQPVFICEIDLLTSSLQHLASEHEPTLSETTPVLATAPRKSLSWDENHSFPCWLPMLQPKVLQWTNPLCVLLFETAP